MIKMETNKKVYYKGHPTRGAEIIKALEELGGINRWGCFGNCKHYIYFIDNEDMIRMSGEDEFITSFIVDKYTELTLSEPKIEFKCGDFLTNIVSGKILIFKEQITEFSFSSYCDSEYKSNDPSWRLDCFRKSTPEEKQHLLSIIDKNGKVWNEKDKCIDDKVYEFKPKDWVLVRDDNTDRWLLSIFSFKQHTDEYPFVTIANKGFKQCIPYEGNENLLGTTNNK